MSGVNQVRAVFFSATGTTEKTVMEAAGVTTERLELPVSIMDFTLPRGRGCPPVLGEDDLVISGIPVYVDRVPGVLLKLLDTLQGNHTLAVPVVFFGDRNYDNALIESHDPLHKTGFRLIVAAIFVGEHSFSWVLVAGKPDAEGFSKAGHFG